MRFAERRRVQGEGMDFTPQFSSQLPIPQLSQQLGDERGYKKNPLFFIFVVLFLFSLFFFFVVFSLFSGKTPRSHGSGRSEPLRFCSSAVGSRAPGAGGGFGVCEVVLLLVPP